MNNTVTEPAPDVLPKPKGVRAAHYAGKPYNGQLGAGKYFLSTMSTEEAVVALTEALDSGDVIRQANKNNEPNAAFAAAIIKSIQNPRPRKVKDAEDEANGDDDQAENEAEDDDDDDQAEDEAA